MGNRTSSAEEKRTDMLLQKHGIKKDTLAALQNRMSTSFENGVIRKHEFVKMYMDYYQNEFVQIIAERVFETFDFDHDGLLSKFHRLHFPIYDFRIFNFNKLKRNVVKIELKATKLQANIYPTHNSTES
ncbi:hypothetical protein RF11_15036 [Thelohanellus kitauei]|uniref:EF-hand domain-containing protein n=1 Tax=Thelohanellus kitauei TaxID=669202 RepID=A0A0C2MQ85_THEKT|nr:hypothetical protein RF11_15036 [Thelohanellus kitauei]